MKVNVFQAGVIAFALVLTAALAEVLTPRELMARSIETFDLQTVVPKAFGEWEMVPNMRLVEPSDPDSLSKRLYSQELARGYRNREGHMVMLLVAYGPDQSERLQLHRPEICYAAEGFRVSKAAKATVSYGNGLTPLPVARLVAQREARLEPITYWMRVGNDIATGPIEQKLYKALYGLKGVIPDGALVRVSSVGLPEDASYKIQEQFISDLFKSLSPDTLGFFVGEKSNAGMKHASKKDVQ